MVKSEVTETIFISVSEIKEKFGIKGEIVGFSTPTRQKAKKASEKFLYVKILRDG
ncbi:MAG: hypothetical protein ACE5RP_00075 [Nitrosopumilus sp.]